MPINSLIKELEKELLEPFDRVTIDGNTIYTTTNQKKAIFEINPKEPIPNTLFEQQFYINNTTYHIVQIYPI